MNNVLSTISPYVVSLVTIVGLIVLLAIGVVSATAGLPLIAALAGVHGGAALKS